MTEPKLHIMIAGDSAEMSQLCTRLGAYTSVASVSDTYAFALVREAAERGRIDTVVVDLSAIFEDINRVAFEIFRMRERFPEIVFCLVASDDEFNFRTKKLSREQRERLTHYFRLQRPIREGEVTEMVDRCVAWHRTFTTSNAQVLKYKYDVALSFANEDREHAFALAEILRDWNIDVFYDDFEQAQLWGKNLREELFRVYSSEARYCVVFVSEHYLQKMWTNLERQAAQDHALHERSADYLLPIHLDDSRLPAQAKSTAFVDLRKTNVQKIASILIEKLGNRRGAFLF